MNDVIHHIEMHGLAEHVLSDPLHHVYMGLNHVLVPEPVVIYGTYRVNPYDLYTRFLLFKKFPCPRDGPACPSSCHEIIYPPLRLLPYLRACGPVMGLHIVLIVVLINQIGAWRIPNDPLSHFIVTLRGIRWDCRRTYDHLCAKGP